MSSEESEDVVESQTSTNLPETTLKFFEKIGYALGHIFNDLAAGVWYSYTLIFLQGVQSMPGSQAGAMLMLGQVADAISTPIVGFLTDKIGTKKSWHIFGSFLVLLSFPMIFSICPFCDGNTWWMFSYYPFVIIIFQFGWPVCQITHLAMIPELSRTQRDRSDLTALRYSAMIVSVVTVFCVTWAVIDSGAVKGGNITPDDGVKFREIALILTAIGAITTIFFHLSLTASNYDTKRQLSIDSSISSENDTQALIQNSGATPSRSFFKCLEFYQVASLYIFARIFMTIALVYIPLWVSAKSSDENSKHNLLAVFQSDGDNIATVPLASFISSFVTSIISKQTTRFIGHRFIYLFGCVIGVSGCIWIAFEPSPSMLKLYLISIIYGAGHSMLIISSLSMTADFIGLKSDKGGSIYSAVTFFDKLLTGVAVFVIEALKQGNPYVYYRHVLSFVCGVPAVLGILTLFTLVVCKSSRSAN